MPFQPIVPTWLALNAANDQSASGFLDLRTQQPVNAGGLNLGDYFDLTDGQALQLSYVTQGRLWFGRYRRIQVDANATAAQVAKGYAAYIVPGYSLDKAGLPAVNVNTVGSGQTAGTYTVTASGGGGSGAVIQYVINASGTLSGIPTVVTPGSGYTSTPTFTLAAGGTPGTVQAIMVQAPDIVTDYSHALATGLTNKPAGVFLNSITPGNFGFIQQGGLATVLYGGSITATGVGGLIQAISTGVFDSHVVGSGAPTGVTVGQALDAAIASSYGRVMLDLPTWPQ